MSFRGSEFGTFCSVESLEPAIAQAVIAKHDHQIRPCIYDIYTSSGTASVCVHQEKIYTVCVEGVLAKQELHIKPTTDKHLYFVLMYLRSRNDQESLIELVPFLSEYDLIKLIQNRDHDKNSYGVLSCRNGHFTRIQCPLRHLIVKLYLQVAPIKQIPPAAMQESLLIELFVDAGWTLDLDILLQYYDHVFYRLYLHPVKCLLTRGKFERNRAYPEAYNRFLELSLERREDDIYELLEKHK